MSIQVERARADGLALPEDAVLAAQAYVAHRANNP